MYRCPVGVVISVVDGPSFARSASTAPPPACRLDVVVLADGSIAVWRLAALVLNPQELFHALRKQPGLRVQGQQLIGSRVREEPLQPHLG